MNENLLVLEHCAKNKTPDFSDENILKIIRCFAKFASDDFKKGINEESDRGKSVLASGRGHSDAFANCLRLAQLVRYAKITPEDAASQIKQAFVEANEHEDMKKVGENGRYKEEASYRAGMYLAYNIALMIIYDVR